MKAKFLALAALVLGLASCQTEPEGLGVNVGGEQDVTVCVSLPEVTRANNSADGAFKNLVNSDEYTIRYIFQVFYKGEESGAARQVIYSDGNSVSFPVRLVPGREYSFVAWADVVPQTGKALNELGAYEQTSDFRYDTSNLEAVTFNEGKWDAMDETFDAYTDVQNIEYYGTTSINLNLTRPFAKLRVLTTDLTEIGNLGLEADRAVVEYSTPHYRSFNALTGVPANKDLSNKKHEIANIENKGYEDGVLFVDYFFATKSPETVNFVMEVYDNDETDPLKVNNFNTDIPVQRNYLTTISGNILTDGNNVKVDIVNNGEFEGNENWPDTNAEKLAYAAMFGGVVELDGDIDLTNSASNIVFINDATIKLNGHTITAGDVRATGAFDMSALIVNNGATLTIEGEGTIQGGHYGIYAYDGNLTIKGGNIKAYSSAVQVREGNANIEGGVFSVTNTIPDTRYVINCIDRCYKDGSANINITGGMFKDFNPADNAAEGNGTNFCAEGFGTAVRDGYYVVVPQVVADLDNVTEATEVKFTEDLNVTSNTTIHTQKATAAITIDGNGKSVVSTAESADDFQWENGQFPAMSTIFSSVNGDKVTVSNLSFEGTMSALMLGHYVDSNSNWFNTELNNVNVVNTEVVSFSQNIAPAVCVYGKATLNNCNIYGTTLSELDTDPMWPVYDVAVVNEAVLTINNSNVGTIIAWAKSKVVVETGSVVESIKPIYTSMNTNAKYGFVIKAGATVKVLDLSNINASKKINITIEDGATVGKVIGANGAEYPSLEAYIGSVSVNSAEALKDALATEDAVVSVATGNYTFPSSSVKAGQTIICEEGVVFTGTSGLNINGATVIGAEFKNENGTAVSGTIYGNFKNCTFTGYEALRWCYSEAGKTTVFENCVIKTDFRGFHYDDMNGDVIFRNCEINGFNAYGGEGTATFEGCTFGCDESRYNGLNIYANTNLVNCTFNFVSGKTNFVDLEEAGKTLTIINCKANLDGVAVNIADYVGGSKKNDCTVTIM